MTKESQPSWQYFAGGRADSSNDISLYCPVTELMLEVQMNFRVFSSFTCCSKDLSVLFQVHKSLHGRLLARAELIHTSSPT
jgi:hypothetical protein